VFTRALLAVVPPVFLLKVLLGILLAVLLLGPMAVLAAETAEAHGETPTEIKAETSPKTHNFDDSNWFFYMSAGVGQPKYDESTQATIDSQKAIGLESPQAGTFDFPGVYRKISPGFAAGATLHVTVENYARNWREGRSFAIQTYSPTLSAFYFTSGKMGEGWFGRADLGPSRFYQRLSVVSPSNQYDVTLSHRDGVFAQMAAGYGWEASHFARVLVHVNALIASAGPNSLKGATFNIGFLL
jgi:hypothetical protein